MKIIKITLFVMTLMIMATGMAQAAAQSSTSGATSLTVGGSSFATTGTLNLSSNVAMTYNGTAQAYGVSTQHLNGNRMYGGWNGTANIYYKAGTANGTFTAPGDPGTTLGTGWTIQ